jgi:uncharacterized protein YcbK (DUF882 family)
MPRNNSLFSDSPLDRRSFLKLGAAAAKVGAVAALAGPSFALAAPEAPERALSFYNLHTSEKLKVVYWAQGAYIPDSLAEINHLLRDHRTGAVHEIDRRLLDLLSGIRTRLETTQPFEIISGYRSPATNAALRSHSSGVASQSLHLKGMAADIRVSGRDLALLRKVAVAMQSGGVGYYPSQFVHVDVGRVRTW